MSFLRFDVHHANFEPFRLPVLDGDGSSIQELSHLMVVNSEDVVCAGIPDPDGGTFMYVYLRDGKVLCCWGGIDQFCPVESLAEEDEA